MSDFRNPSPPPSPLRAPSDPKVPLPYPSEAQAPEEVDEIAGTVFSKSWVLALLVRTVEYVSPREEEREVHVSDTYLQQECEDGREKTVNGEDEESSKVRGHSGDLKNAGSDGDNMDSSLEEDLCLLWDASMNSVCVIGH